MAPTASPALTNPRPLAYLAPTELFVLHCTIARDNGTRRDVVLADNVTAVQAFALIDEDDEEVYDDFLLSGDEGQTYVPCFRRRGWIKQ